MPVAKNTVTRAQALKLMKKRRRKKNTATKIPAQVWLQNGIVPPKEEYRIYPPKLREGRTKLVPWRIDFAFPSVKVAVEIEGGTFSRGRHVRPKGYQDDMEKYNYICGELGWRILRYTPQKVDYEQIKRVLKEVIKC